MTTYVALLRAINVGGKTSVAMADLRRATSELGFDDVQSLLQTGNLVFRGEAASEADLERLLEDHIGKRLGLRTAFIVRTAGQLKAVITRNPFPSAAEGDPGHLVVTFLKTAPNAQAVDALREGIKGRETVNAQGKDLYIVYPDGIGRSRLTLDLIEPKLGTQGTGRTGTPYSNWPRSRTTASDRVVCSITQWTFGRRRLRPGFSSLTRTDPTSDSGRMSTIHQDRSVPCLDCSSAFSFSAVEQGLYYELGYLEPSRCGACRLAIDQSRRKRGFGGRLVAAA